MLLLLILEGTVVHCSVSKNLVGIVLSCQKIYIIVHIDIN
jgi:hypothetical protein